MASATADHIERFDEVLDLLAGSAPEYHGGLSNHGPMAAEALVRLGRAEEALPWARRYMASLDFDVTRGRVLDPGERRGARGVRVRYGDWVATMVASLKVAPWQAVVADTVVELLPGAVAAATHCLIRTAHAVRALEEADTPARRLELARALAYWSAAYVEVPGIPLLRGTLDPADAAASLPRLPEGLRGGALITEEVAQVGHLDGWEAAVDRAACPADVDGALSALTRAFAGWYLAEAESRPIAFVHGVTAPAATRLLLPYLPDPLHSQVYAYAWQVCAALLVAIGTARAPASPSGSGRANDAEQRLTPLGAAEQDALADRAVGSGDVHAIKLTEACVREYQRAPDVRYLAAARDVGDRLHA